MELKPVNNEKEPKYPNKEEINNVELNKPLNKWKKIGITSAVLATLGIMGTIYVVKNSHEVLQGSAQIMSIQEIAALNSEFEIYEGHTTGVQIKTLINRVIAYNNTCLDEPDKVSINEKKEIEELNEYYTTILSKKLYNVILEYNDIGLITSIKVEEVNVQDEEKNENKISLEVITKEGFIEKIEEIINWANHNGLA